MNATKLLINVLPTTTDSDDISSSVTFDEGNANFWYEPAGYYKLVIDDYDDTGKYEKYWGDDELQNVNGIKLDASQLYFELSKLPGVKLSNPYGPNDAIDIVREKLGIE